MVSSPDLAKEIFDSISAEINSRSGIHWDNLTPEVHAGLKQTLIQRIDNVLSAALLTGTGDAQDGPQQPLPMLWEIYHHVWHLFEDTSVLCKDEHAEWEKYESDEVEKLSQAMDAFEAAFPKATHGEEGAVESLERNIVAARRANAALGAVEDSPEIEQMVQQRSALISPAATQGAVKAADGVDEKLTLHIERHDKLWSLVCDEEPGLMLAHPNLTAMLSDVELAVTTLRRLNKESGHDQQD